MQIVKILWKAEGHVSVLKNNQLKFTEYAIRNHYEAKGCYVFILHSLSGQQSHFCIEIALDGQKHQEKAYDGVVVSPQLSQYGVGAQVEQIISSKFAAKITPPHSPRSAFWAKSQVAAKQKEIRLLRSVNEGSGSVKPGSR